MNKTILEKEKDYIMAFNIVWELKEMSLLTEDEFNKVKDLLQKKYNPTVCRLLNDADLIRLEENK